MLQICNIETQKTYIIKPTATPPKTESSKKETSTERIFWLKELASATVLLDSNFNIVDASDEWKRKFFFDDLKMNGKSITDIFPAFLEENNAKLGFAYEGLKGIQMRDDVQLNDGSTKKIIWHLSAWKNNIGSTVGVMLTAEDITALKELEYDLLKAKDLLAESGKIAQIGSWEYDVESEKLILSDGAKKIFKIQNDSKISIKSLIGFCGQKEKEEIIKTTLHDAMQNGTPWDKTLQIPLSDTKEVWVKTIGRPKFKNGKCSRIVGTAQIVEREVTAEETEEFSDKALFFEKSPSAMAVVDLSNGHIVEANRMLLHLSGMDKAQLGRQNCLELFENNFKRTRFVKIANHSTKKIKGTLDFIDKKGNAKVLYVKGRLINDAGHLLCTVEDKTEDYTTVKDLNDKVFKAKKEVDKLLNFNRVVFHNLKGHAINYKLMFDFLENAESDKEAKEILNILRYSTKSLFENIFDLKEMVTISNGVKTKKSRFVINDYIFKVETNLTGEIKLSNAKIINEIPDALKVNSYPLYLENILNSCISNAIKFKKPSKPPLITISHSITKTHTIISIADNGIGMDLSKRGSKLFQIASSLSNDTESRGMGLFLVKHQMDILKGEIEVESLPNEGTTIHLSFPHK